MALGQGVNYRTVANQFGVADPSVCRIAHEETKAIGNNLNHECVNYSKGDAEYFDALVTFQGKHIPNRTGDIDGSHIVISCAPTNARLISTIGRHTTPFSCKESVMSMANF